VDPTQAELRERHVLKWEQVLRKYFSRSMRASSGARARARGSRRCGSTGALGPGAGADLFKLAMATATVWAKQVSDELNMEFDPDRMTNYVQGYTQREAASITWRRAARWRGADRVDVALR